MSTGSHLVSTLENNKGKSIAGLGFIGVLTATLVAYYKKIANDRMED